MTDFSESAWASSEFSANYLERADVYISERRKMFGVVRSFCSRFFPARNGTVRLLDLGSGDGVLAGELMEACGSIRATLVDASEDMLRRARERLGPDGDIEYVRADFKELLAGEVLPGVFDLAVSSLAIHHLDAGEKAALFEYVYGRLEKGGAFVNMDVVLPPSETLEGWYFELWKDWMRSMQTRFGFQDEAPEEVVARYKDPASMNRADTLEVQLGTLRDVGFRDVDCYYKNGIFAVFGGRKLRE